MANDKPKTKRSLFKRGRKHRLKYISVLPSFITLLNGICGFASISFASKGFEHGAPKFQLHDIEFTNFGFAALLIFIAMIADMLDGRVARMSHSTSSFGGQLDSLCDAVSFGVAPAFLALKYLSYELANYIQPSAIISGFLIRFIWLSCAVYLSCTVIRLARFNVENEEDESAHMSFTGLPSPSAAGVIASLILFVQNVYIFPGPESAFYRVCQAVVVYSLPFITLGAGFLMVTRVIYPHVVNKYVRGRKPLTHLIWSLAILALLVWNTPAMLMISFVGFALFGFIRWLWFHFTGKSEQLVIAAESEEVADIDDSETEDNGPDECDQQ